MSELQHRVDDAKDRVRTEVALYLRRYARRAKDVAISHVEEAFAKDPTADPELVAEEAMKKMAAVLAPAKKQLPK